MPRVLTIDDNPLFLTVMNDLLARFPNVHMVGSAINGIEGLAAARALEPDMVIVDMKMPGLSGLEVAEQLHRERPDVRVVLISFMDGEACQASAAAAGAESFICKKDLFSRLPAILNCLEPALAAA